MQGRIRITDGTVVPVVLTPLGSRLVGLELRYIGLRSSPGSVLSTYRVTAKELKLAIASQKPELEKDLVEVFAEWGVVPRQEFHLNAHACIEI